MPLQNSHYIDLIGEDPANNEVILGMTEGRPWDGSDQRVFELQEKVNAYLSFALDGEMEENFPQFIGRTVRLQLDCAEAPDPKMDYFIGIIREQIGFQGIKFEVRIKPELAAEAASGCCQTPSHVSNGGGGCCGGGAGHHHHGHSSAESGCCGGGGGDHHHHHAPAQTDSGCCGGGGNGGGCGCN